MTKISVSKEDKTTGMKKFILSKDSLNGTGLSVGKLIAVELGSFVGKDTSLDNEFAGIDVPRLSFIFEQIETGGKYIQSHNAIPSSRLWDNNKNPKNPTWAFNAMKSYIQHYLEVFTGKVWADIAFELDLDLDEEVYNKDGYEGKHVAKEFEKLFKLYLEMFEGKKGTKKIYEKPIVIKMLVADNNGNINKNGSPGLPKFVGDGVIELFVEGKKPVLKINIALGESIEARAIVQAEGFNKAPEAGSATWD